MREQLVDAGEHVGPLALVRRVVLLPGLAAVGRLVRAAGADADVHLVGVLRVDRDRVEPEAAEARRPLSARRVIVKRLVQGPGHAAVLAPKERRRLDPRPQHVRLRHVTGLDVPGLAERSIAPLGEGRILRDRPRFSHVAAVLDARTAPRCVDRRVHRSVARVVRRVVQRHRGPLRPLEVPLLSLAVTAQDEKALLRSNEERDFLRHDFLPV